MRKKTTKLSRVFFPDVQSAESSSGKETKPQRPKSVGPEPRPTPPSGAAVRDPYDGGWRHLGIDD